MTSIHDEKAIISDIRANKLDPELYNKVRKAVYKDLYTDFSDVPYLPKSIRNILGNYTYKTIQVDSIHESNDDQTTKFLLKTHDDMLTECVIMRHLSGRNTLCISSQVGCPMACTFCATGKIGIKRNLTFSEILDQVMIAIQHLKEEGRILRNIVFMGMGEPLLNYDQVTQALSVMIEQGKLNFSPKRVTISTCGIVPGIDRLGEDFPQTGLAISLHAPNDDARRAIMPVNHTYPVDRLMKSLDTYVEKTKKKIFYEYIMIRGQTDRPEYAKQLAELLKDREAHVNFIPYNPGENITTDPMQPSSPQIMKFFQQTLKSYDIPTTVRMTMGDDIAAACGQLANKKQSVAKQS